MTRRPSYATTLAGLLAVLLTALVILGSSSTARAQDPAPEDVDRRLELVEPLPFAADGQPVTLVIRAPDLGPDDGLSVRLHDRVRSRSELGRAIEGSGLRATRSSVDVPAASLKRDVDGSISLTLPTGPEPGSLSLAGPGVYPLTIRRTGSGSAKAVPLVSQLVVPPAAGDTSPALGVAIVADLSSTPARTSDGLPQVDAEEMAALRDAVAALGTVPGFPLTLAPGPETMVALTLGDDTAAALLTEIAAGTGSQATLAGPFVRVAPDALAAADLEEDFARQLVLGEALLQNVLGATPVTGTWMVDEPLGRAGLELLRANGIRQVMVDHDLLVPTNDRVFSLARPFALAPPGPRQAGDADREPIVGLTVDAAIATRLRSDATPAAVRTQVIAELAALWAEQPTVRRSVVITVDRTTPPEVIAQLEQGLTPGGFLQPMQFEAAVDWADPLTDGSGNLRRLALATTEPAQLDTGVVSSIRAVRGQLDSLRSLLPADDLVLPTVEADILRAEATGLSTPARGAHLDDARLHVASVVSSVTTEGTSTVTLTSRTGKLPLTLVNHSTSTLTVKLRLRGAKVEVPGGREREVELPPGRTILNIDVRTRASGSIPLELTVSSPDDRLLLTSASYRVQSTAVSGLGVVLSAGAMIFLLVWWGRHWRKHQRSRKLVDADTSADAYQ